MQLYSTNHYSVQNKISFCFKNKQICKIQVRYNQKHEIFSVKTLKTVFFISGLNFIRFIETFCNLNFDLHAITGNPLRRQIFIL